MAWIKVIDENEAQDKLKEYYQRIGEERGRVANILKVHSLNPESLRAHFDLYRTFMFGQSSLSRTQREMIAVAVSRANGCHY